MLRIGCVLFKPCGALFKLFGRRVGLAGTITLKWSHVMWRPIKKKSWYGFQLYFLNINNNIFFGFYNLWIENKIRLLKYPICMKFIVSFFLRFHCFYKFSNVTFMCWSIVKYGLSICALYFLLYLSHKAWVMSLVYKQHFLFIIDINHLMAFILNWILNLWVKWLLHCYYTFISLLQAAS